MRTNIAGSKQIFKTVGCTKCISKHLLIHVNDCELINQPIPCNWSLFLIPANQRFLDISRAFKKMPVV